INSGKINSIMEGTSIEGEIKSDSNIRIDGRVKGTVNARGRVIIGQTGIIEGEVICQSSDIEGTLIGKINCQDLLSLKATAKLQGDINTKKLAIEPGAVFTGNCSMAGGVVKEMAPPQTAPRAEQPAQAAR
ncbi:MAG TPA: polymer-forming cytoskeletal protein, partial [Flavobacteriales bacterium]|nr:polymer-forming cytoskeletal protein [Flavobacteriales bacterium]